MEINPIFVFLLIIPLSCIISYFAYKYISRDITEDTTVDIEESLLV